MGLGKAVLLDQPDLLLQDWVDWGKAVHVIYLDFSKAFVFASHSILLEKLAAHGLERCTHHLLKSAGWLGPESASEWSYI